MITLRKLACASLILCVLSAANADTLYFTSALSSPNWSGTNSFTVSGSATTKDPTASDDVIFDWGVNPSTSANLFINNDTAAQCNSMTIQKDGKQRWLMIQIGNNSSLNIAKDLLLNNNWGNSNHRIESRYSKATDLNIGGNLLLSYSPLYIGGEWDAGTNANYAALRKVAIAGDIRILSSASTTSALYTNVGFDGDGASVDNAQVQIGGKVVLTNSSAKTSSWYVLNRGTDTNKVKTAIKTFIQLNGLEGNGSVLSYSRNELGNEATLIFKNTTDSNFTGALDQGAMSKFNIVMSGVAKQTLRGTNTFTGSVKVESGTLLINNAGVAIGDITLAGGKFGAIGATADVGKLVAASLTATGGSVYTYFDGATCSLMSLVGNLTADGGLNFFFDGDFLAGTAYRIFEMANSSSFASDDFTSNVADATFDVRDGGVYVTFAVPEPATFAAIFGAIAMAVVAYRRRGRN